MEKWKSVSKKTSAFTIVELLTVMGVIAILISLLVPALNLVRDYAREIQQRAQFHSIEVAIDMFVANSGYGTYPPSNDNSIPPANLWDPTPYGGAQKLAEALVGWDLLGYHPESLFISTGEDGTGTGTLVYDAANTDPIIARQNVEEREGPFIDLENANAFRMGDIYTDVGDFDEGNYVLCDVYAKKLTGLGGGYGGKKIGMPILYYRARENYIQQNCTDGIDDDIYYYPDNMKLLLLGDPEYGASRPHILIGDDSPADWQRFEDMILNNAITTMRRPYRANSYILISAGKDGIYGTGDDLMNFAKE